MLELSLNDLLAVSCVQSQGLLAEDILAMLQTLEDIASVGVVRRSDQDRLYFGSGNQLFARCVCTNAILCCNLVSSLLEIIRASNNFCTRYQVVQTADVIAANGAAANNTNI